LNYIRCHDDIGLGFDDQDARAAGYQPHLHRRFLIDYFTGVFEGSTARGKPFASNDKTGDSRISGSLASLAGLESALESGNPERIDEAIRLILLLHGMILSFGGIPLLYYGDEIGTLNDISYMDDISKANDNRWIHRPRIDWKKTENRHKHGSHEYRLFTSLQKMIAARKAIPAFADFNNREVIDVKNPHLFVFLRSLPDREGGDVLVIANFDVHPQHLELSDLGNRGYYQHSSLTDLYSGESPPVFKDQLVIPPLRFFWLTDKATRMVL
jgi:amylosucrase